MRIIHRFPGRLGAGARLAPSHQSPYRQQFFNDLEQGKDLGHTEWETRDGVYKRVLPEEALTKSVALIIIGEYWQISRVTTDNCCPRHLARLAGDIRRGKEVA